MPEPILTLQVTNGVLRGEDLEAGVNAGFSELWDESQLKLPASSASTFALTLLDDTTQAAMRTTLGLGSVATISSVPNANLAAMATATIKGRATAGSGSPEDLTIAQLKTLLALAIADVAGKATTWWRKLDALWVHAAHSAEVGRLNWLGSKFDCLPVNNPTFTVDRGYAGNGTSSYLDTQFNPTVESPLGAKYQQDSASFGVRSNTDDAGAGSLAGFYDGTKGTTIQTRTADARSNFRVNTPTYQQTLAGATPTGIGMFAVTRTGATVSRMYRSGSLIASSGSASQAPANGALRLGAISSTSMRAAQFSMGFVGGGLTDAEVLSLYNWFIPYREAVGVV